MAGNLQFELVSPERKLASVSATEVHIPAMEGDMTAMAGHVPTLTTLRPGVLKAVTAEGVKAFIVTGGFADISANGVSVLAERAIPTEEATNSVYDELVEEARSLASVALPEDKASAEKMVNDVIALRDAAARH